MFFAFSFFAAVIRGRASYVFSFMFMLMLMLMFMFMFMFIPIPMFLLLLLLLLLLMFFSFCFGFGFDSGFYSYLPLSRVFVSYRREIVRFPVDLSGRGTEQRFCVFYPHFPSSVRRGAASDRVVYRKHGYSAQSGGRTLFHDHL